MLTETFADGGRDHCCIRETNELELSVLHVRDRCQLTKANSIHQSFQQVLPTISFCVINLRITIKIASDAWIHAEMLTAGPRLSRHCMSEDGSRILVLRNNKAISCMRCKSIGYCMVEGRETVSWTCSHSSMRSSSCSVGKEQRVSKI